MNILSFPCQFLKIYGVIEPENLDKFWKFIYKIYSFTLTFLMIFYAVISIGGAIKEFNGIEYNKLFFISIGLIGTVFKNFYLLIYNSKFVGLTNMIDEKFSDLQSLEELKIQKKYVSNSR